LSAVTAFCGTPQSPAAGFGAILIAFQGCQPCWADEKREHGMDFHPEPNLFAGLNRPSNETQDHKAR
jgi:hypothetical protein